MAIKKRITKYIPNPLDPIGDLANATNPGKHYTPGKKGEKFAAKPSKKFNVFVGEVKSAIDLLNKTLQAYKEDPSKNTDYENAVKAYRDLISNPDGIDANTVLVDPVLDNGYIIDVRILAHVSHSIDTTPVSSVIANSHSSSSYISLYPCS